ncbi:MAG: hypothetical protein U5J83_17715 [Bryobacterales bacterium]|nr:hypothetical protein [Bryobacterales bacterium]
MTVTMWAKSERDFIAKAKAYFQKYDWEIISVEDTRKVEPSLDYGEEVNRMVAETLLDAEAVRLGTYYSYKTN